MEVLDFGAIFVALIAAIGAWAAQNSASRSSRINNEVSSRLNAEEQAYQRARDFDIKTIERQDEEIKELQTENKALRDEIFKLKSRLYVLEVQMRNLGEFEKAQRIIDDESYNQQ